MERFPPSLGKRIKAAPRTLNCSGKGPPRHQREQLFCSSARRMRKQRVRPSQDDASKGTRDCGPSPTKLVAVIIVITAGVRTGAAGLELMLLDSIANSGNSLSNTTTNETTLRNITYSTNNSTYNSNNNTFNSNSSYTVLNSNSSNRGELFVISDVLLSRDEAQAFCKNYTVRNANYSKFGNFTLTGLPGGNLSESLLGALSDQQPQTAWRDTLWDPQYEVRLLAGGFRLVARAREFLGELDDIKWSTSNTVNMTTVIQSLKNVLKNNAANSVMNTTALRNVTYASILGNNTGGNKTGQYNASSPFDNITYNSNTSTPNVTMTTQRSTTAVPIVVTEAPNRRENWYSTFNWSVTSLSTGKRYAVCRSSNGSKRCRKLPADGGNSPTPFSGGSGRPATAPGCVYFCKKKTAQVAALSERGCGCHDSSSTSSWSEGDAGSCPSLPRLENYTYCQGTEAVNSTVYATASAAHNNSVSSSNITTGASSTNNTSGTLAATSCSFNNDTSWALLLETNKAKWPIVTKGLSDEAWIGLLTGQPYRACGPVDLGAEWRVLYGRGKGGLLGEQRVFWCPVNGTLTTDVLSDPDLLLSVPTAITTCLPTGRWSPTPSTCKPVCRQRVSGCRGVWAMGHRVSGLYLVQHNDSTQPRTVYCDLSASEGSWNVVLRRIDFNETRVYTALGTPDGLQDYLAGVGHYTEEFWIGLTALQLLVGTQRQMALFEITSQDRETTWATYEMELLRTENNTRINLTDYHGTAGDSLNDTSGINLLTIELRPTNSSNSTVVTGFTPTFTKLTITPLGWATWQVPLLSIQMKIRALNYDKAVACPPFLRVQNPLYRRNTYTGNLTSARGMGTSLKVWCQRHLLEEGTMTAAPSATCLPNMTYDTTSITLPCKALCPPTFLLEPSGWWCYSVNVTVQEPDNSTLQRPAARWVQSRVASFWDGSLACARQRSSLAFIPADAQVVQWLSSTLLTEAGLYFVGYSDRGAEGVGVWPDGRRGVSPVQCGDSSGVAVGSAGCGVDGDQGRDCLLLDQAGRGYASYCAFADPIRFICSFPAVCPKDTVRTGAWCSSVSYLGTANPAFAYERCGRVGAMPALSLDAIAGVLPAMPTLLQPFFTDVGNNSEDSFTVEILTGINDIDNEGFWKMVIKNKLVENETSLLNDEQHNCLVLTIDVTMSSLLTAGSISEDYSDLWLFATGQSSHGTALSANKGLVTLLETIARPVNCKERFHYALCQTPAILECWKSPPSPVGSVQSWDYTHPPVMPLTATVTYTCPDKYVVMLSQTQTLKITCNAALGGWQGSEQVSTCAPPNACTGLPPVPPREDMYIQWPLMKIRAGAVVKYLCPGGMATDSRAREQLVRCDVIDNVAEWTPVILENCTECLGSPPEPQPVHQVVEWSGKQSVGTKATYYCNATSTGINQDAFNVTCQDPTGWTPAVVPPCYDQRCSSAINTVWQP